MVQRSPMNADVAAGLMFGVAGLAGYIFGRKYEMGTLVRLGPGYLPMVLSAALGAIGATLIVKGLIRKGTKLSGWSLRPLVFICGTFFVFSYLINAAGLFPAATAAMLVAAFASREFKLGEQVVLGVVGSLSACVLFIWALGLPMKIVPYSIWPF